VNGRSPLDPAKLVPGVQFTNGSNYAVASSNEANEFTVNEARRSQNQLTINGIGNVDTGNNGGLNVAVSRAAALVVDLGGGGQGAVMKASGRCHVVSLAVGRCSAAALFEPD
jgi:hypothetical protein